MKVCTSCARCYEDVDILCAFGEHKPLQFAYPGSRMIGENYFLHRFIGKGGTGAVYAATDLTNDREVAIKLLLPALLTNPRAIESFRQQGARAERVHHPNVVATSRCGVSSGNIPYHVMELLEGTNLRAYLLERGPLPLDAALDIAAQIAAGLNAAHRENIVHRDLTPSNIVLTRGHDGQCICKLIDFGVSAAPIVGTPRYMSPEQYVGAPLDERADLFSFGVILYEMLAGKPPFPGPTPREVMRQQREPFRSLSGFPQQLEELVSKALRFDRAQRVQTAAAFQWELRQIQPNALSAHELAWSPPDILDDETLELDAERTVRWQSPRRAPFYVSRAAAVFLASMPIWFAPDQPMQPVPILNPPSTLAISNATLPAQDDAQGAYLALTAALAEWIAATNARDFDRQAEFYPPTMDAFYLWRKVSRKAVLTEKRRLFAQADVIDIRTREPEISLSQDGLSARMRFNKHYVVEGAQVHRTGEVLQELRWVKSAGRWQIVSERDLRVIS